jgi:hypothetical protein
VPKENYLVRVSPQLLEAMTLAAIEAFCYGDGGVVEESEDETEPTVAAKETLGYVWGYRKREESRTVFYLDRMSLSISATREFDSVHPNPKAARLKNDIVRELSPELTLLADFHSQPYASNSVRFVKQHKLYQFSKTDFDSFSSDDFLWDVAQENPVMLVVTVCRRGSEATDVLEYPHWNVAAYSLGQFQFWITAVVGYKKKKSSTGGKKRVHTRNSSSVVELRVDNYIHNLERTKIRED